MPRSEPPPLVRRRRKETTPERLRRLESRHRYEERPFDPAAPREHYAKAHHFAVNPAGGSYEDWLREADQIVRERIDVGILELPPLGSYEAFMLGFDPGEFVGQAVYELLRAEHGEALAEEAFGDLREACG
jgi:hypothetical protein